MRKALLLSILTLFSALLTAQVTFVQTTTDDFMKGTAFGVNIADGSVTIQGKMESFNDWTSTTNLPQVMEGHQITQCRNFVYLVGGFNGSNALNGVYMATQQANGISSWTTLNPLPVALRDMAVVATQTHLYVMGGRNSEGVSNKIYSAAINDNGTISEWTELSITLATACWGARAVTALDNVYIIGGATSDNETSVSSDVYRMTLNAFGEITGVSTVNALPQARNGHAVAVDGSKIIVSGGYNASHEPTNTVYTVEVKPNGKLSSWQTQTALPVALNDHNMVVTNGIIGVFGGYDGSLPCNAFYITQADLSQYAWTLSDLILIERNTKATAFAFGDKIFYSGGESLSGSLNNYIRFAKVNTSTQMVSNSVFVSKPFYIGTPKNMQQLDYTLNLPSSGVSYELLYRWANDNGVFGNWISASTDNPLVINKTRSHFQYMFYFTASGTDNLSLDDVTLTVSGYTSLAGDLNDIETLTLAGSPYWVSENISFTSGTHTIEAGVTLLFSPNTGLNIGRASVNFNGTETQPITLTYQGAENGLWNGVYFEDYSDYGNSSTMTYTVIEKAGNGDNNANLRLYYTNTPTITNCTFKDAEGHGVRMVYSSPTITGSIMSGNTECGLYLEGSQPTCNNCTMSGNEYGLYWANTNFNATLSGITLTDNTFGLYSCSPDRSFTYDGTDVAFADNAIDIAVGGGRVSDNRSWNYYPNGYALFGNLEIYGDTPKLTVAPGNALKAKPGCGIYIGAGGDQGGMLYAVGTQVNPITFTAFNGEIGGWDGIKFRDGSDYNSSSSMRYCVVEKAATNIWCQNTTQPSVMWCTIKDATNSNFELNSSDITVESSDIKNAQYGMYLNSSKPTLINVIFDNLSEACVWENNILAEDVTYYNCTMKNSNFGIRYHTPNQDIATNTTVTFQNNYANQVIPGGDVTDSHVWGRNTCCILSTVKVGKEGSKSRLTLSPGCTLKFSEGAGMEISQNYYYYGNHDLYGELNAIGTASEPIVFTSKNGEVGGWNGLYFHNNSDNIEGMESVLKYCVFENANEYNVQVNNSEQPSTIENCTFKNSANYGLCFFDGGSGVTVSNCQFQNNSGYAVYCNTPHYVGTFIDNTFTNNLNDGVTMGGGDITDDRTWNSLGDYCYNILSTIKVGKEGSKSRLTLHPGCKMKFSEGAGMEISQNYYSAGYHDFYGELNAIGTVSEPIIFAPINGEVGGWNGLYFHNNSDNIEGMESVLKYCVFENANEYNVQVNNSEQPSTIENCTFKNSANYGLCFFDGGSGVTVSNCQFQNNGSHAVYFNTPLYVGTFIDNTFANNLNDGVTMGGGDITDDRTWNSLGDYCYNILSTVKVGKEGSKCRLTLSPGCILKFSEGAGMEISQNYLYYGYHDLYGELNAIGTASEPIVFTSINGESGGWKGLYFHNNSDNIEGIQSVLKYCTIRKGYEYNLKVDDSNQPYLVENCKLVNSNGCGVWLNNASITVNKCLIRNNASYGVYLSGNSIPTIGGNMMRGCDILDNNNGGYQIYHDGDQDVNMSYNFFGNLDWHDVDNDLLYDKMENNYKGRINLNPVSQMPRAGSDMTWSGHVYYNNNSSKPLSGATLQIKTYQGEVLEETTVSGNGNFSFDGLNLGVASYIEVVPVNSMNGVNSTDALRAMRHFAHLTTLEGEYFRVADVNESLNVNGTDALLIQRRSINAISSFPVGTYYLKAEDFDYSQDYLDMNLSFLWYGDVTANGTGAREGSVSLHHEGEITATSFQHLTLPVTVTEDLSLGAITLSLTYPEAYIKIENVTMGTENGSIMYQAEDGCLNISWYNVQPVINESGALLLNIEVETQDLFDLDEPIAFGLLGNAELADGDGEVIEGVTLAMPMVVTQTMGVNETGEDVFDMKAYPNPMTDHVTITYCLPSESSVTMTLFDIQGRQMERLIDARQSTGLHKVKIEKEGLASGIYYCRLTCDDVVSVVKIVVE